MKILSLFDYSGVMVAPWRDAGHFTMTVDIKDTNRGNHVVMDLFDDRNIQSLIAWKPDIIFAFPVCTDLAVSGAAHFAKKREKNPEFQNEAMKLFRVADKIAGDETPYFNENPVSVAATLWRKPDCYFHPYEYGGYLPEDDVHPTWPDYIAPRDAYPKKTGAWIGNGFIMPVKKPVEPEPGYSRQHRMLGGKSERTKTIRSETSRGWSQAVFTANERTI